ncbi:uncharacterized protein C6orf136 homolog [Thalassophryne amazonica]|uniref:uncharacterized protein C6orf136 homolog n=1 Tax=Thalassophryne amazonica TaxID=390379 RepID=UPI0014720C04|nr:uncharacterized protein C6orf136 homolog [Thalassophryne amazonica]
MAVSRGSVALWVGSVRSHSRRQFIKKVLWSLNQTVDWRCFGHTRPLSSASWALTSPNSPKYPNVKHPLLSHPFHHASQPERSCDYEEWSDSVSVCVLVPQVESGVSQTLVDIPLFSNQKMGRLLSAGSDRSMELFFPLTMVDGSREDDISIETKVNVVDGVKREHECFLSLFEKEQCPAPFTYGSRFYCFHCPGTEPVPGGREKSSYVVGNKDRPLEVPVLLPASLWSHSWRAQRNSTERESPGEDKVALMYERLRIELPNFFMKKHDYTMYSNDMEFINGLLNTKTRGRVLYQLTLSLWRLLCLCYYAEARLEVLKLTKHMEHHTIKARWRIRGLPIHSALLRFYRKDKSPLYRSYDAFSTFYIGPDGLIHCHKVEKVMPVQPPLKPRGTSLLLGALVALGMQEHRPALNLLPHLLTSL